VCCGHALAWVRAGDACRIAQRLSGMHRRATQHASAAQAPRAQLTQLDGALRALKAPAEDVTRLLSFVSLNSAAIRKILKKYGKSVEASHAAHAGARPPPGCGSVCAPWPGAPERGWAARMWRAPLTARLDKCRVPVAAH